MKMSRTRAFLLELVSAGLAFAAGLALYDWGIPGVIILPVCALIAWFQMGWFWNMWVENNKKKGASK